MYFSLFAVLCCGLVFENQKQEAGLGVLFFLGDKYEVRWMNKVACACITSQGCSASYTFDDGYDVRILRVHPAGRVLFLGNDHCCTKSHNDVDFRNVFGHPRVAPWFHHPAGLARPSCLRTAM